MCHCAQCGGASRGQEVDQRTRDRHAVAEYRNQAKKVRSEELRRANLAVESFVSTMSLADKASGPMTQSGGRLWAMNRPSHANGDILESEMSANTPPKQDNAFSKETHSSSSKQQLRSLLERLKIIEGNIGNVSSAASSKMRSVHAQDAGATQSFPLEQELQRARDLRSELQGLKSSFVEIHSAKEDVTERLESLLESLRAVKKTWQSASKHKTHDDLDTTAAVYDTGKLNFYILCYPASHRSFCRTSPSPYLGRSQPNHSGHDFHHCSTSGRLEGVPVRLSLRPRNDGLCRQACHHWVSIWDISSRRKTPA